MLSLQIVLMLVHVRVCKQLETDKRQRQVSAAACLSTCLYVNFVQENLNGGRENDRPEQNNDCMKLH